jgi:hypothetical protein
MMFGIVDAEKKFGERHSFDTQKVMGIVPGQSELIIEL